MHLQMVSRSAASRCSKIRFKRTEIGSWIHHHFRGSQQSSNDPANLLVDDHANENPYASTKISSTCHQSVDSKHDLLMAFSLILLGGINLVIAFPVLRIVLSRFRSGQIPIDHQVIVIRIQSVLIPVSKFLPLRPKLAETRWPASKAISLIQLFGEFTKRFAILQKRLFNPTSRRINVVALIDKTTR